LVPALFTFYIQGVLKLKNNNFGAKRLILSNLAPPLRNFIFYISKLYLPPHPPPPTPPPPPPPHGMILSVL